MKVILKIQLGQLLARLKLFAERKQFLLHMSKGNNDGTVDNLEGFFDDMDAETFEELGGKLAPYTETRTVGGSGPMQSWR